MSYKGNIKLICNNESCINKSVVYRSFSSLIEHECKACGKRLILYRSKLFDKQDLKALKELKELEIL